MTKRTIEDLHGKLETVERKTAKSEDRAEQMDKAIEEQKTQQHKLIELLARLLAKKHHESTQLGRARDKVRNLETENSVRQS